MMFFKEFQMFFPDGPESEELVVVNIVPERMEILDFKHNIIPEPFGLKALALFQENGQWKVG